MRRYERGQTRIELDRLEKIAKILGVPIYYFFQGGFNDRLRLLAANDDDDWADEKADDQGTSAGLLRESLDLVRAFRSIEPVWIRRRLYLMVLNVSRKVRRQEGLASGKKWSLRAKAAAE
jgi:transcriptional regulator with XRE-family HTH domain